MGFFAIAGIMGGVPVDFEAPSEVEEEEPDLPTNADEWDSSYDFWAEYDEYPEYDAGADYGEE